MCKVTRHASRGAQFFFHDVQRGNTCQRAQVLFLREAEVRNFSEIANMGRNLI